jgi:hypothetical protein
VFKNAGYVHIYWLYYLGIALAIASADVVVSIGQWIASKQRILGWAFAAVVVILFLKQTRITRETYRWGISTGHASFKEPYDDQFESAQWVKQVGHLYGGGKTVYFLHDPQGLFRIELYYYIDGEIRGTAVELALENTVRGLSRAVLLVDKKNPYDPSVLTTLMRRHRTYTWDDRFVAVELTSDDAMQTDYVSRPKPVGPIYKWLVNARHAPLVWQSTVQSPAI